MNGRKICMKIANVPQKEEKIFSRNRNFAIIPAWAHRICNAAFCNFSFYRLCSRYASARSFMRQIFSPNFQRKIIVFRRRKIRQNGTSRLTDASRELDNNSCGQLSTKKNLFTRDLDGQCCSTYSRARDRVCVGIGGSFQTELKNVPWMLDILHERNILYDNPCIFFLPPRNM